MSIPSLGARLLVDIPLRLTAARGPTARQGRTACAFRRRGVSPLTAARGRTAHRDLTTACPAYPNQQIFLTEQLWDRTTFNF